MSDIELHQCFNKQQNDFLVSITIHKARSLNVFNTDTFVEISFNNEKKRTRTYRNSDCPYFNEYFVFELRTSLENLLRKSITLSVIHDSNFLKRNSVIGEFNVNLSTVWNQKFHTFVRKWGVLEKIKSDHKNAIAGYLQVDLSIVTRSSPPAPAALFSYDDDIIDENLLHPSATSCGPESVKYSVNIFYGNFVVKRDYIIQVSYGSSRIRTRQIKYAKYCKWNEQIIFEGKFESLNQMLIFELLVQEYYQWRVKCCVELNFSDICWSINGAPNNKPSFGPAFIYFYEGAEKNAYYGKLLISIVTEGIDEKMTVSSLQKKQDIVMPLNEEEYWSDEIFKVNMIVLNADAINCQHSNVRISLSCEDVVSNVVELSLKDYKLKGLHLKFSEFSSNIRPIMSMSIKMPDNRLKNQANNLMKMLSREMESNIRSFKLFEARHFGNDECQVKCLRMLHNDLKSMLVGLRTKCYNRTFKQFSEWDENFIKFIQFTLDNCIETINRALGKLSNKFALFQEYLNVRDILLTSINDVNIAPSDVILNVIKDNRLLAFHRFNVFDYMHSQAFDSKGQFCGKMKSVVVKPSTCMHSCENCGCMFGKFDFILWIGSDKEINEWHPQGKIEADQISMTTEKFHKCNIYVHQAKIQAGIDQNNLCTPKLVAFVNGACQHTRATSQSLSIVWNETLTIENVKILEIGDEKYYDYPSMALYLLSEDKRKVDFIGSTIMSVKIKTFDLEENTSSNDLRKIFHRVIAQSPPQLRWMTFYKNGMITAEVLMSAEFEPLTEPTIIQERDQNEPIPVKICPNMRKFHIEVTFVGIRNAPKNSNYASSRYKIEMTMGELMLASKFAPKNYKRNINFLDPYVSGYIMLPEQFEYWPPIIIKHLDCSYKYYNAVGAAMIRRPEIFFVEDKPKELQRFLLNDIEDMNVEAATVDELSPLLGTKSSISDSFSHIKRVLSRCRMPKFLQITSKFNESPKSIILEHEYTWWTKFYNSNRNEQLRNESLHSLRIFHVELEKQADYEYFQDWAYPIDLHRGKANNDKSLIGEKYAKLKCSVKILKCWGKEFFETENKGSVPTNFRFKRIKNLQVEIPIIVRIYIVQAINLRSHDVNSHSDAFIKIEFGTHILNDRAHYVPNQYSPIFGKRYQVTGVVPKDIVLKISIYDRDTFVYDDLIGKTEIDIEDRMRSKYGAACGLMKEYNYCGYNAWRHPLLPSEILANLCSENELSLPQYFSTHATLAGIEFKDTSTVTKDHDVKERLALSMLHKFHKIPGVGHNLVPEHVETRSLHRKDRPGVEQGKLLMWIEIFDPRTKIPEPVDITPTPPRNFELRVIIWNAKDVILNDRNIFGKGMTDIYVKGWMENIDDAQFTDVHYRSLTGEGNFNWRMVFSFKYSIGEDMMIITKKKNPFEKFDTEIKIPAVLNLQIWDNDTFSPDDFLGAVAINLSHFPQLSTSHEKCTLKKGANYDNLFAVDGSLRGWCAVHGKDDKNGPIKGKLEIEIEVLNEDGAKATPAGKGRDPPQKLPPPNRPDTSFNWYEQPLMSFKHILWPQMKNLTFSLSIILLVVALILFITAVAYGLPQAFVQRMLG